MAKWDDRDWRRHAKGLLKAELKRRGLGYHELANRLASMGIHETPANISNKINRGGFSGVFLLQCLEAMDCRILRIVEDEE